MNDLTTWLRPSPNVHIGEPRVQSPTEAPTDNIADQSPRAVLHRVLLHLPEQAMFLLQGRVRVINVWRPIEHPVEDYPLAVCDPSSVLADDLIECDHVRRKFKGANMYSHFSPGQKWYYMGEQRPEEALLIKMFDSDASAKTSGNYHHL